MRRKILSLSLVFVLALGCVAQQRRAEELAPSVERLRAHVSYLASDKLEGRRTGSAGATLAAEYVAREFARAGLRRSVGRDLPGMSILEADSPRRYMQAFPFVAGVEPGPGNALVAKPTWGGEAVSLKVGADWMPLGFSSNGEVLAAPAVFVHYGIVANGLNRDDYANTEVRNKVVVALDGTPDGDNPHGIYGRYGDPRWKALEAKGRGAKALVLLSLKERFGDDRLSALSYDNSGEAGLPVVALARPAWERLLASATEDKKGLVASTKAHAAQSDGAKKFEKFSWSLTTDVVRRETPAYNVVGILEGSDPVLKGEAIVIGAHYDHLGRGGQGSLAPREGEVHHGADDNASGVAGVLELARLFAAERTKMKRTLVLIAFGGEEEGLLGSNFYVNHPVWPLDKTVAMINMDMIGRMKERKLMIGGTGTAAEWRGWIDGNNFTAGSRPSADPQSSTVTLLGFTLTLNEDGYGPSDHSSFYAKHVPVLFFFTGTHDDYHKPSDTAEKIAYEDEARLLGFIANIVRSIDASAKRPTYAVAKSQTQGRSMGFRVYLGTIPNYAESNDGMTLDGVREDSPAAAAGLKAGDKIIKMAGREVRNVYDYTYALGEMKAGEEYEVEVVRGGQTLKLKITPQARK